LSNRQADQLSTFILHQTFKVHALRIGNIHDKLVFLHIRSVLSSGLKSLAVKKGESAVMPANVPHALAAKERFKMLMTFIK
jgi:mannose-6-phosphate isomerase class I